jgi:hypothetical protein
MKIVALPIPNKDEELLLNGIVLLDEDSIYNIIEEDYYDEACSEIKHQYAKYKKREDEVLLHDLLISVKVELWMKRLTKYKLNIRCSYFPHDI